VCGLIYTLNSYLTSVILNKIIFNKKRVKKMKSSLEPNEYIRTGYSYIFINGFIAIAEIDNIIIRDSYGRGNTRWITVYGYSNTDLLATFVFEPANMSIKKAFNEWNEIHSRLVKKYSGKNIQDFRKE